MIDRLGVIGCLGKRSTAKTYELCEPNRRDSRRRSNREIKRMLYLAVNPIPGPVPDRRGGWWPVPLPGAEVDSKAPLANVAHSAREG